MRAVKKKLIIQGRMLIEMSEDTQKLIQVLLDRAYSFSYCDLKPPPSVEDPERYHRSQRERIKKTDIDFFMYSLRINNPVTPAKAGVQNKNKLNHWIPAVRQAHSPEPVQGLSPE